MINLQDDNAVVRQIYMIQLSAQSVLEVEERAQEAIQLLHARDEAQKLAKS